VTNDHQHAGERDADAAGLAQAEPVAEQRESPQRDEQRTDRLQQQAVDCGRVLQAVIGERVVGREAGQREHGHQSGVPADGRPIAHEMRRGERRHDQEGSAPANESERYRRHVAGDKTPEHDIAGPK
jgi:hypothetical protein